MNLYHAALISIPFVILFFWACAHFDLLREKTAAAAAISFLAAPLLVLGFTFLQPGDMPLAAQILLLFGLVIILSRLSFSTLQIQAGKREFWLVTLFAVSFSPVVLWLFTMVAGLFL